MEEEPGTCGAFLHGEWGSFEEGMASLAMWSLVNSHSSLQGVCVWAKNKACHTPSAAVAQKKTLVDPLCVPVFLVATPEFVVVGCWPDSRMDSYMATSCFGGGASCRGPGQPGAYSELPLLLTTKPNKPFWCSVTQDSPKEYGNWKVKDTGLA